MFADLRYALRQLRKSPGFALTAILTFAIGIGANTVVFSFMDALVLHPLAIPNLDRVVTVAEQQNSADAKLVALANFEDWKRQSHSFDNLAARAYQDMNMSGAGDAAHVEASAITPGYFSIIGAKPWLGRVFRDDEAQPGRDAVTVISYSFWQRQFGGDASILNRSVELDGRNYTVVGIMPRSLGYPTSTDVFVPFAATPDQRNDRHTHDYQVFARLRPGVTPAAAQAEMKQIAQRLEYQYPSTNLGWSVSVAPLLKDINGDLTTMYFRLIMAATGFVLLIVCANIANLQFARGLGRRSEIAVRTALGARRWLLLRQLLVESILLGIAGAAAGLLFAQIGLHVELAYMPERVARFLTGWSTVSLNSRALILSMILAVAAGVISGIAPAFEALRINLVDQLKAGSRTSIGSGRSHRLRNIFAVAQISLAVALVIGAALMAKGMRAMLHMADRFHPAQTLTFDVHLPLKSYATPEQQAAWYTDSLARLRAIPGVKSAQVATSLPQGNEGSWMDDFQIENRSIVPGQSQTAGRLAVSAGFFQSMDMHILSGRPFEQQDGFTSMPVAVVSRNFAQKYFPNTSALGHRIRMGASGQSSQSWITIIGVSEDVSFDWTQDGTLPAIFLNVAQIPPQAAKYIVISGGESPLSLASAIRKSLAALDRTLPLDAMQTYEGYLHEALTGLIYAASMLILDACIALLLAAIGIFGVMANLVSERRREIGLRLTLGARREDVTRMFLRRAGVLTLIGLGAGVVMAAGLARVAASLLFGVNPGDIAVFVTATIAIAAIALLSSWLPVRSASGVDPVQTLREE